MSAQQPKRGMLRPNHHGPSRGPIFMILALLLVCGVVSYNYYTVNSAKNMHLMEIEILQKKLDNCNAHTKQLSTNNEALQTDLEKAGEKENDLKQSVTEKENRIQELEKDVASKDEEITRTKQELEEIKSNALADKESFETLKKELEELKAEKEKNAQQALVNQKNQEAVFNKRNAEQQQQSLDRNQQLPSGNWVGQQPAGNVVQKNPQQQSVQHGPLVDQQKEAQASNQNQEIPEQRASNNNPEIPEQNASNNNQEFPDQRKEDPEQKKEDNNVLPKPNAPSPVLEQPKVEEEGGNDEEEKETRDENAAETKDENAAEDENLVKKREAEEVTTVASNENAPKGNWADLKNVISKGVPEKKKNYPDFEGEEKEKPVNNPIDHGLEKLN